MLLALKINHAAAAIATKNTSGTSQLISPTIFIIIVVVGFAVHSNAPRRLATLRQLE